MKNSIAAVTGGFGLVGSQIVEELVCAGWQVKILSRIKRVSSSQNVTVIQSDLNDPVGLKILLEGVDAIFHCAAELIDEKKMYLTNVKGTRARKWNANGWPPLQQSCKTYRAIGQASEHLANRAGTNDSQ